MPSNRAKLELASQKRIGEKRRLKELQKRIDLQNERRKKRAKIKIKITKDDSCLKLKDLDEPEIDYLKKKGYLEYKMRSVSGSNKELYLIRPRKTESIQHIFLVKDISNYLSNFTNKVRTYQTVKPDIVFDCSNNPFCRFFHI